MKKLILILFAAVAVVACRNNRQQGYSSSECAPTPNKVVCPQQGSSFTIRTAVPSYFAGATIWEMETEENPTAESSPLYYTVRQVDATTYDVEIKPFTGTKTMYMRFGVGADSNAGMVAVNCQP